jgi:hypothetical protein
MSLEKGKKKASKLNEPLRPGLISKTSSLWNIWPRFNQEV